MAETMLSYVAISDGRRVSQKNRSRKVSRLSDAFMALHSLQQGIRFSMLLPPPLLCATKWSTVMCFCFICCPQYAQWPPYRVYIDSRLLSVISPVSYTFIDVIRYCGAGLAHSWQDPSVPHGLIVSKLQECGLWPAYCQQL